jgi:hypothetical protein
MSDLSPRNQITEHHQGGGHLLPVEDHEGMSVVGAAVCSVAAALEVPPAATFLP